MAEWLTIDMLLLRLRKIIVGLLLCHILSWCGWRSKDECFINGIGSGRTEGEDQHSLRVNYTRLPLPVLYSTHDRAPQDLHCTKWYTTIQRHFSNVCYSGRNIGQWQMVASLQSSVCYRSLTFCCCYCCSTLLLDGQWS